MAILRKKIIAGNWKMNKTASEARQLVADLVEELGTFDQADIVICPPFTAIPACADALENVTNISLGAQNLHQEKYGAFTGEISGAMLRDLFCRYVIVGHSERRQLFGETCAIVNAKAKAAFAFNLRPIICVGETLAERENNQTQAVITAQLRDSFAGFSAEDWAETIIAYEPVWAIGTGKTATPTQAQEIHALIRSLVASKAGEAVANKLRIQYGGSVKPDNAAELLQQPDIDGALVGGASLEARSFVAIIKNACSS
ncbi:MAG: triose-phosphate isomerase [Candidatus Methylacidiphilales bacterium]